MFTLVMEANTSKSLAQTFAYFTSVGPEDAKIAKPLKSRRLVREEGLVAEVEDEIEFFGVRTTIRGRRVIRDERHWHVTNIGRFGRTEGEWTLEEDSGTRIRVRTEVYPRGINHVLLPLVRSRLQRILQGELDDYVRALESDLT